MRGTLEMESSFLFKLFIMEYQEIIKKDGKHIIFCNFEDLLTESFGVKSMREVESFKKPNGEYICHCPFCKKEGHKKHKLYIKSDLTVGHCFVCTRAFVNVTDKVEVSYQPPKFLLAREPFHVVKLSDPEWSLDRFNYEFDDYSEFGYRYLVGRHKYMDPLYKVLKFKFWDDNIVMPFYYHDELIYYQIRFTKQNKIRYFFPPIKGGKPPYIIEHGDNKNFIICEGVYDAIALLIQAPSYTPMAVLGSSISDYQLGFLREYVPRKIVVYMDDTEKSIGVANKIRSVIDYCPIGIIRSDGTDPEEKMINKMHYGKNLQWIK